MTILSLPALLHNEVKDYWDKQSAKEDVIDSSIRERWEDIDKPAQDKIHLKGDDIIQDVTDLLSNGFKIVRSETQWRVHEAMLFSLLPVIYGEEWEINQGRILKKYGIEKLAQEVMIVMARREGKSYSVGMGVAALMLLVPGINIAVFATGKRMAQALLDITKNFLELAWKHGLSQKGYTILNQNAECVIIRGPDSTIRSVRVMPGTPLVSPYYFFIATVLCMAK